MAVVDTAGPNAVFRDYSLAGPENRHAVELGLASAEWYHSNIPRKELKALMKRSDAPAVRDTVLWLGLILASAAGSVYFWGSWATLPFLFVYGVLYGSSTDSRWHECGHGTAFRTDWMNDAVYYIASFMLMRNPVSWRWSHARHHTDTLIVGRDPEISVMRPPQMAKLALHFIGTPDVFQHFAILVRNALGVFGPEERDYLPEAQIGEAKMWARWFVAIHVVALVAAIYFWSILPLLLIGGPRIYGCWHMVMTGFIQHGGLAEDVVDHRLNSRTVYMNPVSRWLYWNMNYHVEHHMFPMVPYHALPALHEKIKDDLPPPNTSIIDAYRELIGSLIRQMKEPGYYVRRELPPTAKPYREEFHASVPSRAKEPNNGGAK